ncbi:MAG: zinc ribbon domain-containing protein [Chloroflexi bacterium]|nr:zinc ribbon domain-containing protein [Chloroflexota bacterium]
MLWLTIAIALLLAILAIAFVAWPLWHPSTALRLDDDSPLTELIQRKDSVLLSIKELEFDYQTGKLSSEDYQRLDQRLRQQAISLLRQLEKVAPDSIALEAELEAAIRQQRQTVGRPARDEEPASAKPTTPIRPHRFCPQCGAPTTATANFCATCGAPLHKADVATNVAE